MKEDLEKLRKACPECRTHEPSLPKEKPKGVINPRHPFQLLHANYFHMAGKIVLVTVDPYTSCSQISKGEGIPFDDVYDS